MDIVVGDGVGGQLRQLRIGLDDRSDRVAHTDFLELNENMSSVREAVGLTRGSARSRGWPRPWRSRLGLSGASREDRVR